MSAEINLLPWRDERRERRRRRWRVMLLGALLFGVAAGYGLERYHAAGLEAQQRRHALIARHVEALRPDVQAVECRQVRVADLERRLAELKERLEQRGEVLALFNGLAATRMEGVRYSSLVQREGLLVLTGSADNHRRIAAQLRALEASPVFAAPSLSEVAPLSRGWRFRLNLVWAGRGGRSS
ncbi:fimbrial assembly protein (PilN) [Halomonas elongata]|uniref:Fimbrial assembly protein (PilN) n=1 Tax=Halomonas elongata TaxID=2746 RepID=A0A1B8NX00_HALEL|nr:PilN domain-containing protein [Halomonas elongata]OBX34508.1 fimbrial assembly protein (PilN) [Halomonas elongata]